MTKKRPAFDSGYSQIEPDNNSNRKALLGIGLALGLGAVIWGGYTLYNRNTEPVTPAAIEDSQPAQPAATVPADTSISKKADTTARSIVPDSLALSPAPVASASVTAGTFRYILETPATKTRALKRIDQLALVSPKMKMETADSTTFTIYVDLPGTAADTARIKDSLNAWYWGRKIMKVSIQQ
ncbi:MAG: hypothetical protein EOO02_04410 [Chitinophagaceae bacterium]|nr:MAG: hypothetical protein EOO02_04410 [Chitinophagaceae bacterium]